MTMNELTRFIQTKSVGRLETPINEQMTERIYAGMKRIAMDTMALGWTVPDPEGYEILRRIDAATYIRYPRKPQIDSGDQLDIEHALNDALAYLLLVELERQRAKTYMGLYHSEVDRYNDNLTQTYLAEASNDSPKFHVFP